MSSQCAQSPREWLKSRLAGVAQQVTIQTPGRIVYRHLLSVVEDGYKGPAGVMDCDLWASLLQETLQIDKGILHDLLPDFLMTQADMFLYRVSQ